MVKTKNTPIKTQNKSAYTVSPKLSPNMGKKTTKMSLDKSSFIFEDDDLA
jgi:hypothetical protein